MSGIIPLGKKWVKVAEKTWIEVDENIPDEKVIERYLNKLNYVAGSKLRNPRGAGRPKKNSNQNVQDIPKEND